jgi:hypothetical protein
VTCNNEHSKRRHSDHLNKKQKIRRKAVGNKTQ